MFLFVTMAWYQACEITVYPPPSDGKVNTGLCSAPPPSLPQPLVFSLLPSAWLLPEGGARGVDKL